MEQPQVDPSAIELSEIEFDHEELRVFWELARYHAKLNAAPTYFGPTTLESVPPPAWVRSPTRQAAKLHPCGASTSVT